MLNMPLTQQEKVHLLHELRILVPHCHPLILQENRNDRINEQKKSFPRQSHYEFTTVYSQHKKPSGAIVQSGYVLESYWDLFLAI